MDKLRCSYLIELKTLWEKEKLLSGVDVTVTRAVTRANGGHTRY